MVLFGLLCSSSHFFVPPIENTGNLVLSDVAIEISLQRMSLISRLCLSALFFYVAVVYFNIFQFLKNQHFYLMDWKPLLNHDFVIAKVAERWRPNQENAHAHTFCTHIILATEIMKSQRIENLPTITKRISINRVQEWCMCFSLDDQNGTVFLCRQWPRHKSFFSGRQTLFRHFRKVCAPHFKIVIRISFLMNLIDSEPSLAH